MSESTFDGSEPKWMRALMGEADPLPTYFDQPDASSEPEPPDNVTLVGETPDPLASAIARLGAVVLGEISTGPPAPLLCGRLDPAGHTIFYGTGGVGKGVYTAHTIARLVGDGHRVMIVDYENHGDEWARRYHGLAGRAGSDQVLWVAPLTAAWAGHRGAIWKQVAELRELAAAFGATYIVIDSIVPACGGSDPMDPGTVALYTGALEYLGIPVLSLAHVTKADDLRYPFGSIFWHNLARVTWSLQKDGEQLVLTPRKSNNYAKQGRTVVTVTWLDGLPRDVDEQAFTAVVADRIADVLAGEALTVRAIVAGLNDELEEGEQPIKADTVRAALRRGVTSDPKRFTVDGTGDMATWRRA